VGRGGGGGGGQLLDMSTHKQSMRLCTLPCPHARVSVCLPPSPLPCCFIQLDGLTREMENGRLFRLISKLAFVTDRTPSDGVGGASSPPGDTGDPYLLALFRDYVFHQGERDGGRVVDWGHIVENLNKVGGGCEGGGWRLRREECSGARGEGRERGSMAGGRREGECRQERGWKEGDREGVLREWVCLSE